MKKNNFYEQLYSEKNPDIDSDPYIKGIITEKISENTKLECEKVLTEDELYKALVELPNNKTPGLDGFPI